LYLANLLRRSVLGEQASTSLNTAWQTGIRQSRRIGLKFERNLTWSGNKISGEAVTYTWSKESTETNGTAIGGRLGE
jgi:hypothetical protein